MKESQVIDALAAERQRREDAEAAERIAADILAAEMEVAKLREENAELKSSNRELRMKVENEFEEEYPE